MSVWLHLTGHFCAVDRREIHAAKALPRGHRRKTYDAVCGRRVKPLAWPIASDPTSYMTTAWPPYVKDAREWGYERCPICLSMAPGKPSRPALTPADPSQSQPEENP